MKSENLPITGPCPIDLDATDFDRSAKRAHCAHCQKDVHNLSQMTEGEARDFLRSVAGQKVCVSYARDRQGKIHFSSPDTSVVPLTQVRARSRAAAAAGIGLAAGLGLAACTPHDNDRVQKPRIEVDDDLPVHSAGEAVVPPKAAPTYDLPPPQIDPNEMIEGELVAPEPDPLQMVEGKIKVPEPDPLPVLGGTVQVPIEPIDPIDPIEMVDGEIEAPPIEPTEMVRGELAAVEPCDPKVKGNAAHQG